MQRTVKKIIDGDTIEVNRKIGNTNRVRLAGVDAPEKHQRGGQQATNILKGLVGGRQITIVPKAKSYGRVVADVRQNRKLVNKTMRKKLGQE